MSGFSSGAFQIWNEFGDNLPNAPVYDMIYNKLNDVFVVGTLGRGAWKIVDFSTPLRGRVFMVSFFTDNRREKNGKSSEKEIG